MTLQDLLNRVKPGLDAEVDLSGVAAPEALTAVHDDYKTVLRSLGLVDISDAVARDFAVPAPAEVLPLLMLLERLLGKRADLGTTARTSQGDVQELVGTLDALGQLKRGNGLLLGTSRRGALLLAERLTQDNDAIAVEVERESTDPAVPQERQDELETKFAAEDVLRQPKQAAQAARQERNQRRGKKHGQQIAAAHGARQHLIDEKRLSTAQFPGLTPPRP